MFIEQSFATKKRGSIEVICGSMFSGKTEELLRRLRRSKIARQKVEIFKPKTDNRYHDSDVVSHDANSIASTPVISSANILVLSEEIDVVGIDEAQFFDDHLVEVCNQLASMGTRVIVAGLDMDFKGVPFGPMPKLMAIADQVTKVKAVCLSCGDLALYSHRKIQEKTQVLVGEKNEYEPLCRACYTRANQEKAFQNIEASRQAD